MLLCPAGQDPQGFFAPRPLPHCDPTSPSSDFGGRAAGCRDR